MNLFKKTDKDARTITVRAMQYSICYIIQYVDYSTRYYNIIIFIVSSTSFTSACNTICTS